MKFIILHISYYANIICVFMGIYYLALSKWYWVLPVALNTTAAWYARRNIIRVEEIEELERKLWLEQRNT